MDSPRPDEFSRERPVVLFFENATQKNKAEAVFCLPSTSTVFLWLLACSPTSALPPRLAVVGRAFGIDTVPQSDYNRHLLRDKP